MGRAQRGAREPGGEGVLTGTTWRVEEGPHQSACVLCTNDLIRQKGLYRCDEVNDPTQGGPGLSGGPYDPQSVKEGSGVTCVQMWGSYRAMGSRAREGGQPSRLLAREQILPGAPPTPLGPVRQSFVLP